MKTCTYNVADKDQPTRYCGKRATHNVFVGRGEYPKCRSHFLKAVAAIEMNDNVRVVTLVDAA